MNVLLFAPALFFLLLTNTGYGGTFWHIGVCAFVQLIFDSSFLARDPWAYITRYFDLSRVFFFKWAVNWRFLPEHVFLDKRMGIRWEWIKWARKWGPKAWNAYQAFDEWNEKNKIHENARGAIGNTPLVMLNRITENLPGKIAVKLEYMNPTCSVKDRAASAMIEEAEKNNLIKRGKTVLVEATSGNMGIALAFYAKIKGYKIVLVMPASASIERRALMKAFGAELIITAPEVKGKALIEFTQKIAESDPNFYWLNQFANKANADMHYRTTGPEIWRQSEGKVDIVCFGVGSGGTVTGTGKFLREKNPKVEIHAVEPEESSVISGHPAAVHKIQGIGAGFVPEILNREQLNSIIRVHSDDAIAMAHRLAEEESILGGISSGANVWAAVQLASKEENRGKLIVTAIPSCGERYLSTALYNEINETAKNMPYQDLPTSIVTAKKLLPSA